MKRNLLLQIAITALLFISLIMIKCTDALKNVDITVNSDIFKYTALVDVSSSSGESLDDATVTLSGADVSRIYNMDGYQTFKINGGVLSFAVDPNNPPTANSPIQFNVIIKKSGYSTINIPVIITPKDSSSLQYVVMVNNSTPPEGVTSQNNTVNVVGGKVDNDTTIYINSETATTNDVSVTLKAGTEFKDGWEYSGYFSPLRCLHSLR